MSHTLYHHPLCPFCRQIRVQCAEKEVKLTLVEEKPWERREEFVALNPAVEIPVMVNGKDTPLSETAAICEYIEETEVEHNLLGKKPADRAEVRRLTAWFGRKFYQEVTRNLVYERYFKRMQGYGGPTADALRAGRSNITYHLDYIAHLTRNRKWLAGDRFSLADIAAATQLSALDYFGDVPWEHNADAKEWYAVVKSRPSFRPLLTDRVPGIMPPKHYEDLDF